MKKMLIVATVPSMIGQFNMANIELLLSLKMEVHVACNFENYSVWDAKRIEAFKNELYAKSVKCWQIDFSREGNDLRNHIHAYHQLTKFLKKEHFDCVHCHTPIASAITRLAICRMGLEVIYTAHGFHFYKGAPKKNWLIYYPVEKICSYMTDILITINSEDYVLAQRKMRAKNVVYIPGIGVDTQKIKDVEVNIYHKRREMNIPPNAKVLLSVGELNKNKNHEIIIKAVSELKDSDIHYVIIGKGDLQEHLNGMIKELGLVEQVHLIGYRSDVYELYKIADVYCHPSYREGLSVALMEAMASGLPCIVSKIRGNIDLIKDGRGGRCIENQSIQQYKNAIKELLDDKHMCSEMSDYNIGRIERFDVKKILNEMKCIYSLNN